MNSAGLIFVALFPPSFYVRLAGAHTAVNAFNIFCVCTHVCVCVFSWDKGSKIVLVMCEHSCYNNDCLSSFIMCVQKMTVISLVQTFFPHMKFGVRQRKVHTAHSRLALSSEYSSDGSVAGIVMD